MSGPGRQQSASNETLQHRRLHHVAQCQPPVRNVLTDLGVQACSHEPAQGDLNRGWPDGPAVVGKRGGEVGLV